MSREKVITVFGSGRCREKSVEYQRAVTLGMFLAQQGFVVCSGGYGGIMEAVSRGAKHGGGKTLGIIVEELNPQPNRWIDKVHMERTWHTRLLKLIETGDGFIFCDGGTGTLTELFTVWEMTNKKMIHKPAIIYGKYLTQLVGSLKKQRLIIFNPYLKFASNPAGVLSHLKFDTK